MKTILVALIAALPFAVAAQTPNTLSKTEKKEGWQLLFDGSSTTGWHTYGQPAASPRWHVQDGALSLTHRAEDTATCSATRPMAIST